ncbi:hypothetical protein FRX31_029679 [Thalictrum thalictroides]|uniref:Uncharacterized protein n=1 Tax=Thalictrum thalictroides TaxID=46969 RepID=A0A7J6V957_THATH|nr:hypothetical protein FRX31_029679 [Thalictrum thalictroides]
MIASYGGVEYVLNSQLSERCFMERRVPNGSIWNNELINKLKMRVRKVKFRSWNFVSIEGRKPNIRKDTDLRSISNVPAEIRNH